MYMGIYCGYLFARNKRFRQIKRARLWKNVILWEISRREISPLVVIFWKKLINLHGGQLDVTTNIYLKSCAYHPDSECCTFFHGNLSDPKSSEDTLLYLYVIWNMLKSADLHETILTPVICHKHVRYHDSVTLYFFVKFPSVAISLRDIALKITFFEILACFICLKRLLLRTLDVNIAKLCNIWFLSFVRELSL